MRRSTTFRGVYETGIWKRKIWHRRTQILDFSHITSQGQQQHQKGTNDFIALYNPSSPPTKHITKSSKKMGNPALPPHLSIAASLSHTNVQTIKPDNNRYARQNKQRSNQPYICRDQRPETERAKTAKARETKGGYKASQVWMLQGEEVEEESGRIR